MKLEPRAEGRGHLPVGACPFRMTRSSQGTLHTQRRAQIERGAGDLLIGGSLADCDALAGNAHGASARQSLRTGPLSGDSPKPRTPYFSSLKPVYLSGICTSTNTCGGNDVNPLAFLAVLATHEAALGEHPQRWLPWNYEPTSNK